ncbi:MAG: PVC-type heme-binding CxxCH protein [Pirellula sp.]
MRFHFYLPRNLLGLIATLSACSCWCSAQEPLPRVKPLEPANTLSSFQIEPGFALELLASEPMVMDPVAMVYDEQGRAFVAEMRDYPFVDKANDNAFAENTQDVSLGQIRMLEDVDGDGKFDKSTVFAEQLSWPTGLALWQGGLYVVATPDLWYLKDTDGDGKADVRRRVFAGFRKFNVQAVINNLKWGLDHKLYAAGSSNGGKIMHSDNQSRPAVTIGTGDFCFDPRREEDSFELLSGGARFGNDFDDQGNRFICNIRNPIQHPVLPRRYLTRNPFLPSVPALQDVAVSGDIVPVYRTSPPEPWRILNAKRLSDDATVASPRSESAATGYMTSACGLTIYRGDVFPEEFYGSVFLGEVAGNLIHHQRLSAQSVTFTSQRSNPNREFLTSTDNWFRPVNFVNAPDGTLHMLDMYRETIEHPWSIPDDIKSRVDLRSGSDRGRIYRIAPIGFRPARPKPQLHKASTAELVAMLSHPSSWWRETAHRLLYERLDSAAVPPLEAVARSQSSQQLHGQDFGAIARLNAIWLLFGLHNLSDEVLLHSLNDTAASVREHAVMLCEERLTSSKSLQKKIVSMADTELSPRVRFQLAFVLSALANHAEKPLRDSAVQPLAALARNSFEDRWIRTAVLCSSLSIAAPVSAEIMASESFGTKPMERSWLYDVAVMIGGRAVRDDVLAFLKNLRQWSKSQSNSEAQARLDGQLQAIQGLLDGLERAKRKMADVMMGDRSSELELIENALLRAAQVAIDRTNENSVRLSAIGLLKHVDISRAREVAQRLLVPDESSDVQSAAIVGKFSG